LKYIIGNKFDLFIITYNLIEKNLNKILVIFAFLSLSLGHFAAAQTADIPRVFMIGEYEKDYEGLVVSCEDKLLSVCDNSMEQAYNKWMGMLSDMEAYSIKSEFDLRGTKIWINVFWNEDGSVKNIVYYPKPNSKNMNFEELTSFFYRFLTDYQLDQKNDDCFSFYGSASFPTFAKIVPAQEK